jgi:serine/threonine protein kinase
MADTTEFLLQDCVKCGTQIDVSEEEPFALMHCPICGAALRVRTEFGNFELQQVLGAGGMGSVYRALDRNLHRQVALKLLRKEYSSKPEFIAQFAHEAAITASVNHPNVVKVYSTGSDHGLFYIAMELVDKGSLDDLITVEETVNEAQVLDVGIQVAQGLDAAFQRGLIHRDVKPANILFADGRTAKIVDFGLAVPIDQAGTIAGEIWGTPYYVAPEKLDDRPEDFRADMYSLAASLFHALAGRPAHQAEDASLHALRELKNTPVSLQKLASAVSSETAAVIDRAMETRPEQRFQTYAEFIEGLENARTELRRRGKVEFKKPARIPAKEEPRNGRWLMSGFAAGVLLGGAALFLVRDDLLGPRMAATDPAFLAGTAAAETAQAEYQTARGLLIAGKYGEAADNFRKIGSMDTTPEPLRSWATFHAAWAATLAGDAQNAEEDWNALALRGQFSSKPEHEKLSAFFVDTASRAAQSEAIPADRASRYATSNHETMALLAFASKDWLAGNFNEAASLFTAFMGSTPDESSAWVAEYKPIAEAHLADLNEYRVILDSSKAAGADAQASAALARMKEAKSRLKLGGSLAESAAAKIQQVEERLTAIASEQAQMRAAAEANDATALAEAQAKAAPLMANFRFTEARTILAAVPATSEKGRQAKAISIQRAQWLDEFKAQLVRDLSSGGYLAPLLKKTGGQLPGTVSRVTDARLELKTQYGSMPVQWSELAPESISHMARSFSRPEAPVERQLRRKWLLGVYFMFAGKPTEGRALLNEVGQASLEYQQYLQMYAE